MQMSSQLSCDLSGEVVIITGSAQGIGKALGYGFAAADCSLMIVDRSNKIHHVAKDIRRLNKNCDSLVVDLSNLRQVKLMVQQCIERYKKIDILINNASISRPSPFLKMTDRKWNKIITNNLNSVFYCCKEVVPHMMKQNKGKIVNFSSINVALGGKETSHYNAAKAGVESLTKSLAREFGPYNIQVNAISPGFTDTKMLSLMPDAQKQKLVKRIPLSRLAKPEDFIGPVLFLSSDGSSYITGQILHVNGGFYLG